MIVSFFSSCKILSLFPDMCISASPTLPHPSLQFFCHLSSPFIEKTSSRKSRNPSSAGDCFVANLVARSKKTKTGFFGSKKMMPKNITCWNFFCWNATFDWKRFRCSTFLFSFSSVRACRKCSWYLIFEQFLGIFMSSFFLDWTGRWHGQIN